MIRNLISDMLDYFGTYIEQRRTQPGVEHADSLGGIGGIFHSDAERQKSQSYYFSDGTRRRTAVIPTNTDYLRGGGTFIGRNVGE